MPHNLKFSKIEGTVKFPVKFWTDRWTDRQKGKTICPQSVDTGASILEVITEFMWNIKIYGKILKFKYFYSY